MAIKIDSALVLELEINGVVYKLREPSVKEMNDFTEGNLKEDTDKVDLILSFLECLGLPKTISMNLGMSQVRGVVDSLTGALSEKK